MKDGTTVDIERSDGVKIEVLPTADADRKRRQPISNSTDDSQAETSHDIGHLEDRISLSRPAFGTIQVGQTDASVTINVQNAPDGAKLDAWIDFDGDGSWGGPFEQIADSVAVSNGDNTVRFDVPGGALGGTADARFRLSTAGNLAPTGRASDGEAKDYQLTLAPPTAASGVFVDHIVDGEFIGVMSVQSADIDGDGDLDVLGAAVNVGDIAWWENTAGDGTSWTRHMVIDSFDDVRSVCCADVDGDGDLDVLGAARDASDIAWWENDGTPRDGGWTEYTVDDSFDGAISVYTADVDGDGDLDVLGAAYWGDDITWWENDGTPANGGWTEHTVDDSFDGAISVYCADVDGDGDLDVLGAAYRDHHITWWENDGTPANGGWTEHTVDDSFDGAISVYCADVDGDGDLDVLGAAITRGALAWWENTAGNGTAWSDHTVVNCFDRASSVYSADVDGDGDLDVLGSAYGDGIAWWENTRIEPLEDGISLAKPDFGTIQVGQTDAGVTVNVQNAPSGAKLDAWIDFDGDGSWGGPFEHIADSVAVSSGDNTVRFDVPSGAIDGTTYARFRLSAAGNLAPMGPANDGEVEDWQLTITPPTGGAPSASGVFSEHTVGASFLAAGSVYSADIDGDGDLDVLGAAEWSNSIKWWENTAGNGTGWTEHTVDGSFVGATSVYSADVDGDGDLDVLGAAYTADDITWWENTAGNGTSWKKCTVDGNFDGARCVYCADVDGDGDLDVLGAAVEADDIS